jgi:hypothetical protein
MPYQRLTFNLTGSKVLRKEQLEGRTHIVVKAAILPPGVIEGSAGPIYYPDDENGKSARAWNHKPIVVCHPTEDDQPISACDPKVLNTRKVGVLLRTVNKSKLQTECWLDEERTNEIDNRIIKALKKGKKIEVSTGLEFDEDGGEGSFRARSTAPPPATTAPTTWPFCRTRPELSPSPRAAACGLLTNKSPKSRKADSWSYAARSRRL